MLRSTKKTGASLSLGEKMEFPNGTEAKNEKMFSCKTVVKGNGTGVYMNGL